MASLNDDGNWNRRMFPGSFVLYTLTYPVKDGIPRHSFYGEKQVEGSLSLLRIHFLVLVMVLPPATQDRLRWTVED